jgi:hypothetical protein
MPLLLVRLMPLLLVRPMPLLLVRLTRLARLMELALPMLRERLRRSLRTSPLCGHDAGRRCDHHGQHNSSAGRPDWL